MSRYYRDGKAKIQYIPKKGDVMDTCATISNKYVCCNVQVIKTVSNCPFDCSYCFLQDYLNDGNTKVIQDIDAIMANVHEKVDREPNRLFRIGTWELGDSLALEVQTGQAAALIERFRDIPNALLELKTKSDVVAPILTLDHGQKTVVSWSLNTHAVVNAEEHKTARLADRLAAMKAVYDAGYLVGVHIDPMILHDNWEIEYTDLVDQLFAHIQPDRLAWLSIGSLRFKPEMKKKMESNFPGSSLTAAEMVLGDDGKLRYPKPIRNQMYAHILADLYRYLKPETLIYFCMERWDMWQRFFGEGPHYTAMHYGHLYPLPQSIEALDYHFAQSITDRYPHLNLPKPTHSAYGLPID